MHTEAAFYDRLRIALQHLKLRLIAVAPEPDIKSVAADVKIEQRQGRQPRPPQRGGIQLSARRVRHDSQDRVHKREDRSGSPSLWHIRSEILHRKAIFVTLNRCVEFG